MTDTDFLKSDEEIASRIRRLIEIEDELEFAKLFVETMAIVIDRNYPYMTRIINQVKESEERMEGYGDIVIQLRMWNGKMQQAVFNEVTKIKFE